MTKKKVVKKEEKLVFFNERMRKTLSFVMLSLVALIGLIFIALGSITLFNQYRIKTEYAATNGVLIAYNEDGKLFIPTYEYRINDSSYFVQADYATPNKDVIGTKTEIYYNKENPKIAMVPSFDHNVLLLVIGLMMVTLPLALYIIDSDTQKDDKTANVKALMVIIFGILYYLISGTLIESYDPIKVGSYNFLTIIVPLFYVFVGVYSLTKISVYKLQAKNQH